MIRIQVQRQALLDAIHAARPSWVARAQQRTTQYVVDQDYTGGSEFWGEIKDGYIDRQFEKCAYCETKLQGKVLASKVHEVEHFRPKASVKAWPDPARDYWRDLDFDFPTGAANAKGYYALAYHPFNYAIACTRCNSTLKSNHFPVAGPRNVALTDPSQGWSEQPLLVYPLSDLDDDPEQLITFDGALAQAAAAAGPARDRALASIAFFQLNHEDLTQRRARLLWPLWVLLESRRQAPSEALRELQDDAIALARHASMEFAACTRAFCRLHETDRAKAGTYAAAARQLLPAPVAAPPS